MYAKVFTQIYDGTLCTKGPWQALVTFQQLLVLADMDGNVDMTAGAIARRTTIPLDIIEAGIEALLQEDPESRTPTENGRRILPLAEGRPWGWKIVNYKHYRSLKREEDRREYHREYWHKRKQTQPELNTTQQPQPNQPIAEAEAEAECIDAPSKKSPRGTSLPGDWTLPREWADWAKQARPDIDPAAAAESFRDYWVARPGKDGRKSDWQATWRNWIRSQRASPSYSAKPDSSIGRFV